MEHTQKQYKIKKGKLEKKTTSLPPPSFLTLHHLFSNPGGTGSYCV